MKRNAKLTFVTSAHLVLLSLFFKLEPANTDAAGFLATAGVVVFLAGLALETSVISFSSSDTESS
ncbi:hypothetical protein E6P09_01660 [Haloferax mediterranei ATCC 33500]|uniref:Uncharacterized protein n=1 Tax=Haloferax mediterranei (strain ATCC 33500 / DSM 1411 / JCM 8866 / NBRC 14739 / NCIMB 2177 / R-4) TaxID=523841 RepID=I3R639_HALMT|nr:hypothetical protein [Haloferax mediterranei]AFK19699.1 hypothetical protein HFX_2007 [Haloferax mediterranei ATCC 33500]AHZ23088.1 hypothetical protein BM92_10775 [Haloferax mediterranei ATCC 33500]EMA00021.1 hypothetical protein C439_11813 [Haloferax mediterranei ATCC 33500]MDX5987557.1 hypothetical protein [Haloferax mediterranei ATCC 33500]QCQ74052.1 hypothetical protein E6P09_01660 [Haloferax mediterranei ATCC 33500]